MVVIHGVSLSATLAFTKYREGFHKCNQHDSRDPLLTRECYFSQQVRATNYLDKDMMYLADAEIDEGRSFEPGMAYSAKNYVPSQS